MATSHKKLRFSRKEIQDLLIAALLVVGVGLSFVSFSSLFSDYTMLALFVTIFALSFFLHEIAHKAVAQRNGLWAEFRLTVWGALLTLASAIPIVPIKFISPGAVMIAGYTDKKKTAEISIAGPLTNIVLSTAFLLTTFLPFQYVEVLVLGAAFNAWIALFNLIPFGIFDGFKVFQSSKKMWALAFAASLVLTIISYQLMFNANSSGNLI